MWAYLRLNLDVSLSKKERPRPPAPLPWLIEETSLLSVPVLAGAAFARRSFAVLPEMVVRYTAPRWKLTLLPAAAPGTVGIRAETPGLDTLSDGLRSQHTSTEYRPLLVHARTDADNQLFHSPHAFNGLACTRSKTPHSVGDPEPRCPVSTPRPMDCIHNIPAQNTNLCTDAANQLFHSHHTFNGQAFTLSKMPHSAGDPDPHQIHGC